jgi:hypothetical protein
MLASTFIRCERAPIGREVRLALLSLALQRCPPAGARLALLPQVIERRLCRSDGLFRIPQLAG